MSDSDSDSYSSDDDYLTGGAGGQGRLNGVTEEEREAIIRRKLMESFYGTSEPLQGVSNSHEAKSESNSPSFSRNNRAVDTDRIKDSKKRMKDQSEPHQTNDKKRDSPDDTKRINEVNSDEIQVNEVDDINSPNFSAPKHTRNLLMTSNTESLLTNNEKLALDIRQLDSTMQTLVYENYSKFIDATDAVRSINRSVDASEEGLNRLTLAMERIEYLSSKVDSALSLSRSSVAEKVRVKRHLSRLDNLLKLPNTLKNHIKGGRYRMAAQNHASSVGILARHSAGFESLATIERDCNKIMDDMLNDLKWKLFAWSGSASEYVSNKESDADDMVPPPLPKNVLEIFECAGTFQILSSNSQQSSLLGSEASIFSCESCKSFALEAVAKMLERTLDRKLQEGQIEFTHNPENDIESLKITYGLLNNPSWGGLDRKRNGELSSGKRRENSIHYFQGIGSKIVPTDFLDKLLETCTLFGVTFAETKEDDLHLLNKFVVQLYSKFLNHVREDLLYLSSVSEEDDDTETIAGIPPKNKYDRFNEIATALTHLIRSTRELSSGLALPEIGIDMDIASSLVDQAVEVTETLIRRYVSVRFFSLRNKVVVDCLAPFVKEKILSPSIKPEAATVVDIVGNSSIAVAEIMQLTDVLIGDVTGILESAPVEPDMIQLSVQKDARKFAAWLASIFEILAGCDTIITDSANDKKMLEVRDKKSSEETDADGENSPTNVLDKVREIEELNNEDTDGLSVIYLTENSEDESSHNSPLQSLVGMIEDNFFDNPASETVLILSLAQVCRMAAKNVIETINSSIGLAIDKEKNEKDHRGRFSHTMQNSNFDINGGVSLRFQLASMRILALYAMDQGNNAAMIACSSIQPGDKIDHDEMNQFPQGPSGHILTMLEIVKTSSIDCATIFGGRAFASEFKPFDRDDSFLSTRGQIGIGGGVMSGLQLDVERMFAQNTPIYTGVLDFERDSVICTILMIAFKAIVEHSRAYTFDLQSYWQIRVDVEFLRRIVPHYVSEQLSIPLLNLLDDIMFVVTDRCKDKETIGDGSEFYNPKNGRGTTPISILQQYMDDNPDVTSKLILTE